MVRNEELFDTTIKIIGLKRQRDLSELEADSLMGEALILAEIISTPPPISELKKIGIRMEDIKTRMAELSKIMESLREEVDSISNSIKVDDLLTKNGICKN